jgi:iron complex transport system permease protein
MSINDDFGRLFSRKKNFILLLLASLLMIFFFLDIFLGSVILKPSDIISVFSGHSETNVETIILKFRLPKAITALFVGIALSLSGLQMQTIFRNPMAGPYVLGVSSGASLGVAIVILGFSNSFHLAGINSFSSWILVISAWTGAAAVMLIIMSISAKIKDILIILIIGIMIASGLSAVVSIMQYFSSETMLKSYVLWTMGSLGNLSADQLKVLVISVSSGIVLSLFSIKMLNALLLGETYAASIGLNIKFARFMIFACTSILAGSVTAFCGPIGFIGIAVPHIVRNIFRTSDLRVLVPGSIIVGGTLMLASDIISQLPGTGKVLPVNSVTSLIGIPVVIWVILKQRKSTDSL